MYRPKRDSIYSFLMHLGPVETGTSQCNFFTKNFAVFRLVRVNYLDLSLHWSSILLDQLFYSEKIEDMKYMFEEERRPGGK